MMPNVRNGGANLQPSPRALHCSMCTASGSHMVPWPSSHYRPPEPALNLHSIHAALLHHANGILHRMLGADLHCRLGSQAGVQTGGGLLLWWEALPKATTQTCTVTTPEPKGMSPTRKARRAPLATALQCTNISSMVT